jgi:hypothetical protein
MMLLTLAALGSWVAACQSSEKTPSGGPPVANSQAAADSFIPGTQIVAPGDCPHDWRPFVGRLRGANASDSNFLAVGERTQVVEWHDCQKFISESGQSYEQLMAIFSSFAKSASSAELAAATAANPIALASALIVDFGKPYNNLGIQSGFNCLFLYYGGGKYMPRVQSFGATEPRCTPPADIHTLPTTPDLEAVPIPLPIGSSGGYADEDVPAVARWDYDPPPHKPTYYAGLKCSPRWCEIGPKGFHPSGGRLASNSGWSKVRRRVSEIKGWNDYQVLAIKDAGGVHPSTLAAYVTPDGDLWDRQDADFDKKWVHMATVELNGPPGPYQAKLGLGPSTPTSRQNHLWMCNGDWLTCLAASRAAGVFAQGTAGLLAEPDCSKGPPGNLKDWWAAVVDPGKTVTYRCVSRKEHGTIEVPGTARWRWVDDDETIWVRCPHGCCQVVHL